MQISAIQLILTGPASSGNDQAGNLFSGQFFGVYNDIEIAAIIDVDTVDLKVPFPVLLIALQRPVKNGLVAGMLIWLALKYSFGPSLQRCVEPNTQVGFDKPPCQPGSDNDAGSQRSAHQLQVGQKIVDPALGRLLLNLFKW